MTDNLVIFVEEQALVLLHHIVLGHTHTIRLSAHIEIDVVRMSLKIANNLEIYLISTQ